MSEYKLYCFSNSGNSYKAALFLEMAGLDWAPVFVDYFNGATHEDMFRGTLNKQGECPVLDHQGKVLSQSGVILQYLSDQTGLFAAETPDEAYEVLRWMLFDNHKFTASIASYRAGHFVRPGAFKPDVMAFLRNRMLAAFDILEKHLHQSEYIASKHNLTIADFSLAGYLFYPSEELGVVIASEFPAVSAWLQRIRAHPGWREPYDLMPEDHS
ncbi:glutathione S-transferase family protein [Cognatishimia activa]|uniref:Disulfide-bond oxidoreductase YfcG n=1 Tax=Cognatishimia activa TaxID=1715691 RepID=A0A0P1IPJ3_9RHOB|nr:glutathione S-transferase [Cognatishimia activa]CUI84964.1 Disulfide-bond oxidoreductase YfcG [Cognatishimia activa]CUK25537.1 Disulfide-bond oxidoreductase YfcG [Cognatishimia activa]